MEWFLIIFFLIIYGIEYMKEKFFNSKFFSIIVLFFLLILSLKFIAFRWQVIPLYILFFISFILNLYLGIFENGKKFKISHKGTRFISITLIFLFIFSNFLFSLEEFDEELGKYYIGTRKFILLDPNFSNVFGKNENRKIVVKVFYPSDKIESSKKNAWIDDIYNFSEYLNKKYGIPKFLISYLSKVKVNSYSNLVVSQKFEKLPVVIISHGVGGLPEFQNSKAEMLASNGYVVVLINHTYGSMFTNINGNIIYFDDKIKFNSSKYIKNYDLGVEIIDLFKNDIVLTMDGLKNINKNFFSNKLDLNSIALMGYSVGGSSALLLEEDNRVKTVVAMDPWIEPIYSKFIRCGFTKDTSILISDEWYNSENTRYLFRISEQNNLAKMYRIDRFSHIDFTDIDKLGNVTSIVLNQSFKNRKSVNIVDEFVYNHFNYYLLDKRSEKSFLAYLDNYKDVLKKIGKN